VPHSQLRKFRDSVQSLLYERLRLVEVQWLELGARLEDPVSVCATNVLGEVIKQVAEKLDL
jgi:hypothetical protein